MKRVKALTTGHVQKLQWETLQADCKNKSDGNCFSSLKAKNILRFSVIPSYGKTSIGIISNPWTECNCMSRGKHGKRFFEKSGQLKLSILKKTKARIAPRLRQESFPRADDSSSRLCRNSLYHNLPLRRKRFLVDFNGFVNGKITRFQGIRNTENYTFSRYSHDRRGRRCTGYGRRGAPTLLVMS